MKKAFIVLGGILFLSAILAGCNRNSSIQTISENQLFTLSYGNFEEQLSVTDLNEIGNIRMGIVMRDGFFYIVDGEAKKTMELNSYGDLLTLFYNEDSQTKYMLDKSNRPDASIHKEISYPFDYPGKLAVDSNKCIYAACSIPRSRQESGDGGILYSQAVLRFARDGSFVDYIGQQGPGGTPFPYIRNIFTTAKDELVVICNSPDGFIVYWFGYDGFLKYMIPINSKNAPRLNEPNKDTYLTVENVIPAIEGYKLFVKVDYYSSYVDEESKVQSGINYLQTMLYTLDCESGVYEDPVSIPAYEESVVVDYSRLTYKIPYDFLGVTKNGWKFFIIKTDDGFNIEMIQNDTQRLLMRHFTMNHSQNLYYDMDLSQDGIITALYVDKEAARVVWYRTDNLIDTILKN